MKVGLNLLYLIPGKVGGTETYARELVASLCKKEQVIIFCGKETKQTFVENSNLEVVSLPIYSSNRIMRIIIEQTLLPIVCLIKKIDILHSLGYSAPIIHPFPSVVTIHDLNWHYHPEDFSKISLYIWKYLTILSAKYSDHVITDSLSSAKSISEVLNISKSKITTIMHGTPSVLQVKPYISKVPYIFTVAANYPHKNLSTLITVFNTLSKKYKDLILIVSGLGGKKKSNKNIKYLGYVSRKELAELYAGATVFVFSSAYEGFGYPVLEAMSYKVPVVSSNAFSLSEVVSNSGILVNPYDIENYVKAISSLLESQALHDKYVVRGVARSKQLNWEKTSHETIFVYNQLLKRST